MNITQEDVLNQIVKEVADITSLLKEKNEKYGNSAINPVRIFSKANPIEQIKVRIDDKLSRINNADNIKEEDEDIVSDLIGYLILLKVAKHLPQNKISWLRQFYGFNTYG